MGPFALPLRPLALQFLPRPVHSFLQNQFSRYACKMLGAQHLVAHRCLCVWFVPRLTVVVMCDSTVIVFDTWRVCHPMENPGKIQGFAQLSC